MFRKAFGAPQKLRGRHLQGAFNTWRSERGVKVHGAVRAKAEVSFRHDAGNAQGDNQVDTW